MSKFKVGDKVRVVGPNDLKGPFVGAGVVHTVTSTVEGSGPWVRVNGNLEGHQEDRFELVAPEAEVLITDEGIEKVSAWINEQYDDADEIAWEVDELLAELGLETESGAIKVKRKA